jgi:hypothetical protein
MNRMVDRRNFRDGSRNFGGRFHLPLQFQQVAPQSIAHLDAQVCEFKESLAKFVLLPQEIDGDEWRGNGEDPEHYEYELQQRHSPVCR